MSDLTLFEEMISSERYIHNLDGLGFILELVDTPAGWGPMPHVA
jgi:hypothetical protein